MHRLGILLVMVASLSCGSASSSPAAAGSGSGAVRVAVSRDTWVSAYPGEEDGNNGADARLKTKGIQEMVLLDIDPASLKGRVIQKATLHLCTRPPEVQRRVTVSTVATEWAEGSSRGYKPQKGSASFRWAKQDVLPWTYAGSDLTSACNGVGNTIWGFADASSPDKNGWQTVEVTPAVVAARVAGISRGFVVSDDVGSEYERGADGEKFTYRLFPNRWLNSRDSGKDTAPYFTVELGDEDRQAPEVVKDIRVESAGMPPGEADVSWDVPKDAGPAGVLGFDVRVSADASFVWDKAKDVPRYLIPMAGKSRRVNMHFRDLPPEAVKGGQVVMGIRAVDAAGNVGPVGTASVKFAATPPEVKLAESPVKPFTDVAPLPVVGGVQVAVIDSLDKVNPVSGDLIPKHPPAYLQANHLWSGKDKLIRLHAGKNEFVAFQLVLTGKAESVTLSLDVPNAKSELLRFRYVKAGSTYLPDPLVACDGKFSIPATGESIPEQKQAAVIADVYVPHDAEAGKHVGTLTVAVGGEKMTIAVELNVWDFTLPDVLSFIPEMNSYGLPDPPVEVEYYRLAHAHRTCLNRLGYNWKGRVNDGCGPVVKGDVWDWSAYDKRFGPLLDGSAFVDLPRKGVPVDVLYLPLNENWPMDINKGFKGGYWADAAFTPEYRAQLVDASRRFAQHFADKGWDRTLAEFFLNGKVFFKRERGGWSGCSAPWIFDEPVNTQDFWALRWYGQAFGEGVRDAKPQAGGPSMVFRCDVSRPQWQRDLLDGVMNVNVVGGTIRQYQRMVVDRKNANGEVTITYGSANPIDAANTQSVAWCLDAWSLGADGVLPWQTIGKEGSWTNADAEALFYPGPKGPSPSIRLKAFRQGQQTIEYLVLLSQTQKLPRWAVAGVLRDQLRLAGKFTKQNENDAGTVDYGNIDPAALWELRMRVGATLDQAKPAAKRKLIDLWKGNEGNPK